MKSKSLILSVCLLLAAHLAMAQQLSISPRQAYLNHLEMLFEEGRHCYVETGNKSQLKRIIEAYTSSISQGQDDGTLSQRAQDSMLIPVKFHKLWGDYHYLNSDADSLSYDRSEAHFKQALEFAEAPDNKNLRDIFYFRFVLHEELAQLYYKQARYEEAYQEMKTAEKYSVYFDNDAQKLDFISQQAICKARIGKFEEALDDINWVIDLFPEKDGDLYAEAIRKKAKILMLQQEDKDTGMAALVDEALKCYKAYFALKKSDALHRLNNMTPENREQYWMHIHPFFADCYRTEGADPSFLYDVALFSKSLLPEFARSQTPSIYTWKQIQRKLKAHDCAIEFVQYEKHGEKQMGALVLRKKGVPKFVRIGSKANLENITLMEGGTLYEAVNTDCPDMKNNLYSDSTIFQSLWTPALLDAIGKDTDRLYFAADGLFHQLAIEYMLPANSTLKTENLYRLSSTRKLIEKSRNNRQGKVLLCGNINFFKSAKTNASDSLFTNDEQAYWYTKSQNMIFGGLPGTLREVEGIQKEYDHHVIDMVTDTMATDTHIASLIGQYRIVHLATHGFFHADTPEGTDLIPPGYDESLSQSGLVFAGATSSLRDISFDASTHDGLLSAREMEQMDFSNVELIILSACQTAQGYMTEDGIYGLQRSLKNAGVKAMVLSLWSIDDDSPCELMQSFHHHMQTYDIHTAFMKAREELMNGKSDQDFNLPEYYNAFILIDVL